MLTINPVKRINANEALELSNFYYFLFLIIETFLKNSM